MNKNQNIAMGISLAVVAIMVGSAEIFGEKEIIFPEITAVAMGALIAPVQSWLVVQKCPGYDLEHLSNTAFCGDSFCRRRRRVHSAVYP